MLQTIADRLRRFYGRSQPQNDGDWHSWNPLRPVRLVDGSWSLSDGQVWRRRTEGGWEYKQDAETPTQWEAQQW